MGRARWRSSPAACRRSSSHAPARAPPPIAPSSSPRPPAPASSRSATTGASSWMGEASAVKRAMPNSSRRIAGSRRAYAKASRIRWRSAAARTGGRGASRISTQTSARKETALTAKQTVAPKSASVTPPIAGPRSRATLMPAALRLTACERRGRGTRAGIRASMAGRPRANPTPTTKVRM